MREQMKEMKSQVKAKAAKNLDMLVHRSESPFTKRVDDYPLPAKFKVPQLETFDGLKTHLITWTPSGRSCVYKVCRTR
jgi:hypothetical protein